MKSLDHSHRTVLENLETFQRAQQCVLEINDYVWAALREVTDELPTSDDPPLKFALDKGGWLQANTFPNWQGTTFELLSIGIENLGLNDLIASGGGEGCRAYIYSILLNDPKRAKDQATVSGLLRKLEPPAGFVPAPTHHHGYLFVKQLGALPVESVCSLAKLKSYFSSPLTELAEWLDANSATIASFAKVPEKTTEPVESQS